MKSVATRRFWTCYRRLPLAIRQLANQTYKRWSDNPNHPSLNFKRLRGSKDRFSIRIGLSYRALGRKLPDGGVEWVWIGTHAEYDQILERN